MCTGTTNRAGPKEVLTATGDEVAVSEFRAVLLTEIGIERERENAVLQSAGRVRSGSTDTVTELLGNTVLPHFGRPLEKLILFHRESHGVGPVRVTLRAGTRAVHQGENKIANGVAQTSRQLLPRNGARLENVAVVSPELC